MARQAKTAGTEILSRTILAIGGSYASASAASVAIAHLMPDAGRNAIALGELIGFLLLGAGAVLAFSIGSLRRAWLVVAGPALVLALIAVLLSGARP